MITFILAYIYHIHYIYLMENPVLNIIGNKKDFFKDIFYKYTQENTPLYEPHRLGCQCEECEAFLHYNLVLSRSDDLY
jgi:hypothetical protein